MRVGVIFSIMDPLPGPRTMCMSRSLLGLQLFILVLTQISFTSAARPKSPKGLRAFEVLPDSMKLSWTKANPDDIAYVIQYKARQDKDFREIPSIKGVEYKIEQMQPHQLYQIQVFAVTPNGRSPPSGTIEVVTGEIGAY